MKIFVDADACPVIKIIEEVAKEYKIPVVLICDTSHILNSSYSEIIVTQTGADSVDLALINRCNNGDVVVTQDYGVAALALAKGAYAIHQSGSVFTNDNIDGLLMDRHLAKKARMSNSRHHIKGPKKRTKADDENFKRSFIKLLNDLTS